MQVLKDNLTMAQNRMKQQVDQHRTKREFENCKTSSIQAIVT